MAIWNKITVMNPVQEQHLIYSYNQHKDNLVKIQKKKKVMIDNAKPFIQKHRPQGQSTKQSRSRDLNIDIENGALMHKMLEINTLPGEYNKHIIEKQRLTASMSTKSLNTPYRVFNQKKVMEENNAIHNRLKSVQSTISAQKLKKDYKQQRQYGKNITACSRRIYNCFLYSGNASQSQSGSQMMRKSVGMNSTQKQLVGKKTENQKSEEVQESKTQNLQAEEQNNNEENPNEASNIQQVEESCEQHDLQKAEKAPEQTEQQQQEEEIVEVGEQQQSKEAED